LLTVWYALSASVICPIFWYLGAPHVQHWIAGLATAALPVAALVISALVLGENVSSKQWMGAACVIAAIALGALWPEHTKKP